MGTNQVVDVGASDWQIQKLGLTSHPMVHITNEDRIWYQDELKEIGIEIHTISKYENKAPKMNDGEFISFTKDIEKRGLQDPIKINPHGVVLNGHHRFNACRKLKKQLKCRIMKFDDPLDEEEFVSLDNIPQRHLTLGQKIAMLMDIERIENIKAEQRQKAGVKINNQDTLGLNEPKATGKAAEIVAKIGNISYSRYFNGKTILTKGSPKLVQQFLTGKITADKGYRIIKNELRREKDRKDALKNYSSDFNDSSYKLYHGLMQEKGLEIEGNFIDLIITDPSYDKEHLYLFDDLSVLALRVLKDNGSLFVIVPDGGPSYEYAFDRIRKLGLKFHSSIAIKHNGHSKRDHALGVLVLQKPMLWFYKGDKPIMYHDMPNLIESEKPDKTTFEWAQSPIEAKEVITRLTVENQIVLDPFTGEGNFGVAAVLTKRYFIGIEADRQRYETTMTKLSRYEKSQKLQG